MIEGDWMLADDQSIDFMYQQVLEQVLQTQKSCDDLHSQSFFRPANCFD